MTANDTDTGDWEPTDEDDEPPDDTQPVDEPNDDTATEDTASAAGTQRSLTEYLQWAVLGILLLVTIIATLRFYFAASTAVDRFVTRQYRPLFQAAFNLVIILVAGLGLSVLVRRLS